MSIVLPDLNFRWSSTAADLRYEVRNPATDAVLATIGGSGPAEVDAAVRAANAAFEGGWRYRSRQERAQYMMKIAAVLEDHAEELAALECAENGKPVSQARMFDVPAGIALFRYYGSLIDKLPDEFHDAGSIYSTVVREPYGVVGAIIPFNWPPIHTGGKIAPALAAGNTVVFKVGEQAPLTSLRMIELIQSVLPADVLHAIPGGGAAAGQALVRHPLVRKLTFTGSTRAGMAVLEGAAGNITPATMELGGKNAFIVAADADLDAATADALEGAWFNQGEACTAASRMLVARPVYEEFVARLAKGVTRLVVGDGADPATHVGPLVDRKQQQTVLKWLETAQAEGAVIAAQAKLPGDPRLANGYFVAPTLFRDVTPDMRCAQEEMFGPLATVTPVDSLDEAIAITNASPYGLMCGLYSRDLQGAIQAARRIDTGAVMINNYNRAFMGTAPFGGAKHSGYGREHVIETLRDFTRAKAIRWPSGAAPLFRWDAVNVLKD